MTETEFKRWRAMNGLTQDQAAARLGVSKSQVANWDAGRERTRGTASAPPLAVRKLMTAIVLGKETEAWPE